MTCIVGLVHGEHVFLGGDSAGVSNECDIITVSQPKVWAVRLQQSDEVMILGATDSFRFMQLLKHGYQPPQNDGRNTMDYMVCLFADSVRLFLKENGKNYQKEGVDFGYTCLVGYRGRLFRLESEYQLIEKSDGFDAIGSGGTLAVGAMALLTRHPSFSQEEPTWKIGTALEVASHYNAWVRPPFHFVSTEGRPHEQTE